MKKETKQKSKVSLGANYFHDETKNPQLAAMMNELEQALSPDLAIQWMTVYGVVGAKLVKEFKGDMTACIRAVLKFHCQGTGKNISLEDVKKFLTNPKDPSLFQHFVPLVIQSFLHYGRKKLNLQKAFTNVLVGA